MEFSSLLSGVAEKIIFTSVGCRAETVYTEFFKAYLGEAGYRHEAVNHSAGEWVRGNATLAELSRKAENFIKSKNASIS